jgi:quercetin dioxygenase-like cupin family protein
MSSQPQDLIDQAMIDVDAQEQAKVLAMLSEHLITMPPSQNLLDSLGKRLENRIQASIAKHAGLRTVRFREGVWRDLVSGIRYKPLWESPQGNSVLVEFAPGASLPLHRHNYLEEGIVLKGGLQLDGLELTQFDYHVSPAGSRHGRIRSKQGALAYLRGSSVGQGWPMFKEVLGGLLPKNHNTGESILTNDGDWIEVQEGLFQKDLWTDGTGASRFFRLEPGTCIEGHYHPLDEECMMLGGDIFLGDILIQEGDYHLAPAGSEHLEIYTDTGALLFVRGAA